MMDLPCVRFPTFRTIGDGTHSLALLYVGEDIPRLHVLPSPLADGFILTH